MASAKLPHTQIDNRLEASHVLLQLSSLAPHLGSVLEEAIEDLENGGKTKARQGQQKVNQCKAAITAIGQELKKAAQTLAPVPNVGYAAQRLNAEKRMERRC